MKSRSSFRPHKYGRLPMATPEPKAPPKLWTKPRQEQPAEGEFGCCADYLDEELVDAPIELGDLQGGLHEAPGSLLGGSGSPRAASRRGSSSLASRSVSRASLAASRAASRSTYRRSSSSRPVSRVTVTNTSRAVSVSFSVAAREEMPDDPMPVQPWCGRCPPLRPSGILPLRPEEVCDGHHDSSAEDEDEEEDGGDSHNAPSSAKRFGKTKTADFAEHMKETITNAGILTASAVASGRVWNREIEDIQLGEAPPRSRFSQRMYDGENPARVLRRLTAFQVGVLERWAINHVKLQCIDLCAREHHYAPISSHRNLQSMKYATMCQLVRRYATGKLKDDEYIFLFEKLNETPLFSGIPSYLLPQVAKKIKVLSSSRERELFRQGEAAQGAYVLVQGDVLLKNKTSTYARDIVKMAPCALLTGDLFDEEGGPFCFQPEGRRVWSRTALLYKGEHHGVTMLLFLPMSALTAVSDYFRAQETQVRNRIISTKFAQAMLLAPKLCIKHSELFTISSSRRNDVLLQNGSKPAVGDARIMLIIEGEVFLVTPRKVARKGGAAPKRRQLERKERKASGEVIGQAALYGLPYPHTAIVASDTAKILSVRAADCLEKLMNRGAFLDPPPVSHSSSPNGGEGGTGACAALECGHEDTVKALMALCRQSARIDQDTKALVASEWKYLGPKLELPRHKALNGKLQQSPDEDTMFSLADICYPRDRDLFPSAQRGASVAQRGGSEWCTTSSTAAPFSCSSTLQALDSRISRAVATSDRLEAAHRSHVAHGLHVEDATSGSFPEGPAMEVPPGSRVLLSCGAFASAGAAGPAACGSARRPPAWQPSPVSARAS